MGPTGNGKSATANTIIGEEYFKSLFGVHTVTETFSEKHAQVYGRKVLVVDTPPLPHTVNSVRMFLKEIKKYIYIAAPCQYAILFVIHVAKMIRIQDVADCTHFFSYLGKNMQDHVMIVFTHADLLEEYGVDLIFHPRDLPHLTELMRSCGDRYLAFNNKVEMGEKRKKQVKKLLEIIESLAFEDCGEKPPNKCEIM